MFDEFSALKLRVSVWGVWYTGQTIHEPLGFGQGRKFEHGFLSGFVSSLGGSFMQAHGGNMDMGAKVALSAALGGTAEALGGGKFVNVAITGAYVVLFNHLMHEWHPTRTDAAKRAADKTTTTGNETSVLVYQDDSGNEYYWVSPHDDRNSSTSSIG